MFKAISLWVDRKLGLPAGLGLLVCLLAAAVLTQWVAIAVQWGCIALQLYRFGYLCRLFGLLCR